MELAQLRTFKVVAEKLHFTRAAEELALTQSAVSYQIKSLELELGRKLFSREKYNVSLTPEGKLVLEYAVKLLTQVEKMKSDLDKDPKSESGTVRLTAIIRSLGNPFIELRRKWKAVNSDISLVFNASSKSITIIESVQNGDADIGFSTLTDEFPGLMSIPMGSFEMGLVVGRTHRLYDRELVELNDLKKETWIMFEEGSWLKREADKIFEKYSFRPLETRESNDGAVVVSMIEEGSGIGLIPSWGIMADLNEGALKMIPIRNVFTDLPVRVFVKASKRPKHVDQFLTFLLETKLQGISLQPGSMKVP